MKTIITKTLPKAVFILLVSLFSASCENELQKENLIDNAKKYWERKNESKNIVARYRPMEVSEIKEWLSKNAYDISKFKGTKAANLVENSTHGVLISSENEEILFLDEIALIENSISANDQTCVCGICIGGVCQFMACACPAGIVCGSGC